MDQLHDIRAFVEVACTGSFMRASENLRQSNSAISKAVSRLESRLGVQLFRRTTRHLSLTEEGRTYFDDCQRILAELERADEAVSRHKDEPKGLLRIHFPVLWAREVVIPALPEFCRNYPGVRLQLDFSEARSEFNQGYDLIVAVGTLTDDNCVVRELRPTRSMIVASPAYLQRAGIPQTPEELLQHECICFLMSDTKSVVPWSLQKDGKPYKLAVRGHIEISDPQAMVETALAGLGLIQGPDILLDRYLKSGRLVQVLQKWGTQGPAINMAWPQSKNLSHRLSVFIEWLGMLASR